jgi:hypothetical protein
MFCHFRPTEMTLNHTILAITNSTANSAHYLAFRGALAGDNLSAQSYAGSGSVEASLSTAAMVNDTWHRCGGVWSASNNRVSWLDGVKSTANTASVTVASQNEFNVGRFVSTGTPTTVGYVCEIGLWNAALSDAEMAALGKGAWVPSIRPASLVEYWPIAGNESPEVGIKRTSLTISNPAKVHTHGKVFRP